MQDPSEVLSQEYQTAGARTLTGYLNPGAANKLDR
jgi:hypothetical protein